MKGLRLLRREPGSNIQKSSITTIGLPFSIINGMRCSMETPRRLCTLVRPDPTFKEQNSGLNLGMNIGMNMVILNLY